MRAHALTALALLPALLLLPAGGPAAAADETGSVEIKLDPVDVPGLLQPARIRRDQFDVPHIFSLNEHDGQFMLGWVHAQDRFFQMDLLRRTFSGTLAEMLGAAALPQDVQLRTLGLRRAAEASAAVLTPEGIDWLNAYVDGVNAYLAQAPLPPEYAALELTSVPPWTAIDSLVLTKGLAFGLSFDLGDLDLTVAAATFAAAGNLLGFDGTALFSEDLYRTAPFDPSISIPGFLSPSAVTPAPRIGSGLSSYLDHRALGLLRSYRESVSDIALMREAIEKRDTDQGSNWWVADGTRTASGNPLLANDPHLALNAPATFYEAHQRMRRDQGPPININGVSFAGTPGVILGCTRWICWGATVHPMDVTDVYLEQLVLDPLTGVPVATIFDGQPEPLTLIPQSYQVNVIGDAVPDNLVDSGVGPLDGGLTLVVPRRNHGPIIALDASDPGNVLALSVQYTGWGATTETEALRRFTDARNVGDFADALQFFDVGSQNWSVADVDGNIAYFTSAELPIREDLQTLNAPDGGVPPFLIRDGTHTLRHEWLPIANPQPDQSLGFEILPFAEMPQLVNPASGYILNANNDPVGTSLDNNPLNQLRPGGGLYYLSPGYATGFRMGRLQRLFDDALAGGLPLTPQDFIQFQANNQLLDAEVLVPYLLAAFDGNQGTAEPALAALIADAGVQEAISRLAAWDFSTPTGIAAGWDPFDEPNALPEPTADEIAASIAATIYSAWRGQAVRSIIDGPLVAVGVEDLAPSSSLAMSALRNLLDSFPERQGVGASGLPFLAVPGVADPAEARDILLLESLRDALDLLASDTFAAAFGNSTDQDDYRWGYLHRIVFDHPLGGPFDVPPAGSPLNLSPELRGFARAGGFGALDASSHSARAAGLDSFMFGSGPSRRFVGEVGPNGPGAAQVIPGGQSGVVGSPFQTDQLPLWLTNHYHELLLRPGQVLGGSRTFQVFLPAD